jgi:hypothetical protein
VALDRLAELVVGDRKAVHGGSRCRSARRRTSSPWVGRRGRGSGPGGGPWPDRCRRGSVRVRRGVGLVVCVVCSVSSGPPRVRVSRVDAGRCDPAPAVATLTAQT